MKVGDRVRINELGKMKKIRAKKLEVVGTVTKISNGFWPDNELASVLWDGNKTKMVIACAFLEVVNP